MSLFPHQKLDWTLQRLERQLEETPGDAEAQLRYAMSQWIRARFGTGAEDDFSRALAVAREVLQQRPGDAAALIISALCLVGLQRLDAAKRHLDQAQALDADRPELHYAWGLWHQASSEAGDGGPKAMSAAVEALEEACRLAPDAWEAHAQLATALWVRVQRSGPVRQVGDRSVQRSMYHAVGALELGPPPAEVPALLLHVGMTCLHSGRFEDANRVLSRSGGGSPHAHEGTGPMAIYQLLIFGTTNLDPVPNEDGTFRSDLNPGDTLTWLGGGDNTIIDVDDPTNAVWDEAQTNQTLDGAVTLDGVTYSAGTPVTPTFTLILEDASGNSYRMSSLIFDNNNASATTQAVLWQGDIPPAGTQLTLVSEINPTGSNALDYMTFVTCFEADTPIETTRGPLPARAITPGTALPCADGMVREVLWRAERRICAETQRFVAKMRPIRIKAGSLGPGLPATDVMVSPEHRILVRSRIAKRRFGRSDVMVAARFLTDLPGVEPVQLDTEIRYIHFLLSEHAAVEASGLLSESLYLGPMTLRSLAARDRLALTSVAARHDLSWNVSPYRHLGRREAADLVARHIAHRRPMVEDTTPSIAAA